MSQSLLRSTPDVAASVLQRRWPVLLAVVLAGLLSAAGCGKPSGTSTSESPASYPRSDRSDSSGAVSESAVGDFARGSVAHKARDADVTEVAEAADTEFERSSHHQSGILTAGSIDDVENFTDYLSFLGRVPQQLAQQCQLPVSRDTRQTIIRV